MKRRSERTDFDDDVIVLSDSDEEAHIVTKRLPAKKRKTADRPKPVSQQSSLDDAKTGRSRPQAGPSGLKQTSLTLHAAVAPACATETGSSSNRASVLLDSTNVPELHAAEPDPIVAEPSNAYNSLDAFVSLVLEVVPDVDPPHVRKLVESYYPIYAANVVEHILHVLFEDNSYPKAVKNKRGKVDSKSSSVLDVEKEREKVDFGKLDREYRGGPFYVELAMNQLFEDFPYIPKPHIRTTFFKLNSFYAPTHLFLLDEQNSPQLPYKRKTVPTRVSGKGIGHDDIFQQERTWLLESSQGKGNAEVAIVAQEPIQQDEECADGIECGCCFTSYRFDKIVQCPDAHLFCTTCMTSYVSNLLGQHDPRIQCMDQSGCKLLFPESELTRFLTPKLLSFYHRVQQVKEVEAAGLDGLEDCPFCEYKVVIENPEEKLFRCENEECGVVSCRSCKKADHLPKSCKEVEEDKNLDARHTIEEAMTKALMRNCPKCQKPFVKEMGCNKMTCPHCHTLSCYICRKIINGYGHFDQAPPYQTQPNKTKCQLWDAVEQRHDQEVADAGKKAMEEYRREHPDIDEKSLTVELPKPVPVDRPVAGPAYPMVAPPVHHGHQVAMQHVRPGIVAGQPYHHIANGQFLAFEPLAHQIHGAPVRALALQRAAMMAAHERDRLQELVRLQQARVVPGRQPRNGQPQPWR